MVRQTFTAQKMKFSIKDFFRKCDQICSFLRIWAHLLKKSLLENFVFCAVFEIFYAKGLRQCWNSRISRINIWRIFSQFRSSEKRVSFEEKYHNHLKPFHTNCNTFQKQPLHVFFKKGILKSFSKFTGKHMY